MNQFMRSNRCFHGRPMGSCVQCDPDYVDMEGEERAFPQLPCIICDKELEPAFRHAETNQPYAATTFVAYGQYGSTIFDPFDGSYLEVNICDECLGKKAEQQRILVGYSESKTVHKPLKPWVAGCHYD